MSSVLGTTLTQGCSAFRARTQNFTAVTIAARHSHSHRSTSSGLATPAEVQVLYACRNTRSPSRHVARVAASSGPLSSSETAEPIVEEIMMPSPVILKEAMSVKEAARLMLDKDVSGAPVVDDNGNLIGVLSESDLIWKGAGTPQDHFIIPPVFVGAFDMMLYLRDNKQFEEEVHKILAKTVGEAMTRKPVSVQPSATMAEAAQIMLKHKVNRLPVVEGTQVVGVITRHDILRGLVASKSPLL